MALLMEFDGRFGGGEVVKWCAQCPQKAAMPVIRLSYLKETAAHICNNLCILRDIYMVTDIICFTTAPSSCHLTYCGAVSPSRPPRRSFAVVDHAQTFDPGTQDPSPLHNLVWFRWET